MLTRGLLAALVALASTAGLAAPAPCKLQQVAQLDVKTGVEGNTFVPVILDGHQGLMFLQLSSGLPALFEGYVEELGLSKRLRPNEWKATIGDRKIEKQARVESTILGRANFRDWDFQILPQGLNFRPRFFDGQSIFGVMTSRFMAVVDLELNLGAGRVNLFMPNKCSTTPVYWESEVTGVDLSIDASGQLTFPMEVEGQLLETSLNTSGRMSSVSAGIVHRYFGFDENSPGIERVNVPGEKDAAVFRAMSLTAKGLEVNNTKVRIREMPDCRLGQTDRNSTGTRISGGVQPIGCTNNLSMTPFSIGTDLLKRLRIYVSYADRKIYFTRAEPVAAAPAAAPVMPAAAPSVAQ